MADPLAGFGRSVFDHAGRAHEVFRAGSGRGVIVIHELPGLDPGIGDFGRVPIDAGHTVYLPSLFGRPGRPFSVPDGRRACADASSDVQIHPQVGGPLRSARLG